MSGAILAWGIISALFLRGQMKAPLSSLRGAIARLERQGKTHADFLANYEEISQAFQADYVLGHTWEEFRETLITPTTATQRIRNTTRPELYFNQGILARAHVNTRYFDGLSNYLVGAGLLFTFLGLVAALYFAAAGVGEDISVAIKALKGLLSAATFKFMTSIAGLFASLVFAMYKAERYRELQYLIDKFCVLLESSMDHESPVRLADESKMELERQTAQLEKFNTDLAISIADALDRKMEVTFTKALEPLTRQLESLTKGIGSANEDALRKIVDDLSGTISGAIGQEIESLGKTLSNVEKSLTTVVSGLGDAGSNLQKEITESGKAVASQFSEVGNAMAQKLSEAGDGFVTKISATVNALAAAIDNLPDRMKLVETGIDTSAQHLNQSSERLREVLAEFSLAHIKLKDIASELSAAAAPLTNVGTSLADTAAKLDALTDKSSAANDASKALLDTLNAYIETTRSNAETQNDRFASLDQTLAQIFTELEAGLEKYQKSIQDFIGRFDGDMAKSLGRFTGAVEELDDTLSDAVDRFKVAVKVS